MKKADAIAAVERIVQQISGAADWSIVNAASADALRLHQRLMAEGIDDDAPTAVPATVEEAAILFTRNRAAFIDDVQKQASMDVATREPIGTIAHAVGVMAQRHANLQAACFNAEVTGDRQAIRSALVDLGATCQRIVEDLDLSRSRAGRAG